MEGIPHAELFPISRGTLSDMTESLRNGLSFLRCRTFTLHVTLCPHRKRRQHSPHVLPRRVQRETIYGKYISRYHPDLAGKVRTITAMNAFQPEGGDILALSPEVIAVGTPNGPVRRPLNCLPKTCSPIQTPISGTVLAFATPQQPRVHASGHSSDPGGYG